MVICHVLVHTPVYSCGKSILAQTWPLTSSAISDDLTLTVLVSVIVEGERTRSICFRGVTHAATPQFKTHNGPREVAGSVSQRYIFASFSRGNTKPTIKMSKNRTFTIKKTHVQNMLRMIQNIIPSYRHTHLYPVLLNPSNKTFNNIFKIPTLTVAKRSRLTITNT